MAMGIVSDKDFDSEKERVNPNRREESKSIPNTTILPLPSKGRGEGSLEVPNSLRNVIGQTSIDYGRQEGVELASRFGISPASASAYANGATSTATYNDRPNSGIITKSKQRIAMKARAKLLLALNSLTPDKIKDAKPRDLAGIAKDMGAVVRQMEESDNPNKGGGSSGPTFVFYSPTFRKEEVFEVVHAKE